MIWLLTKVWPIAVFAGLLINEVSYKGSPEWVEIYNDSEQVSELSGLILKDANNSSSDDLKLDGSIAAHEYKVFENTKSWLNDSGDTLYLISSSSGQTLDQVTFEKAVENETYGRVNGSWGYMEPSKGGANHGFEQVTLTPTETKAPTSEPTKTPTPTQIPTTKAPATPSTTITVIPKTTTTSIATVSSEPEPSSTPQVLGESESSEPAEVKEEIKTSSGFPYGYLLMLGGSITSMVGVAVGYIKHHRDGVK